MDVNRPVSETKLYEEEGMRFRGSSPAQIIADKVSVISSDKIFRRIKDVIDLYYMSQVFEFNREEVLRADNGLVFLNQYINSFMSLKVEDYVDLGSHGMFICSVQEARVLSDRDTMTYTYYQKNVKPRPETEGKKGFVCKVCGYVYEGDELPDDFICPLCKHGVADFEPIE